MKEGYSTHQTLLIFAALRTTGTIWELGAGDYSTPILHAISGGVRPVVTLESDPAWLARFADFACPWHRFVRVADWASALLKLCQESPAGLCFVDQAPPSARGLSLRTLRGSVGVFVCHDSQEGYQTWQGTLIAFRFSCEDRRLTPWTMAVSDTVDVRGWRSVLPGVV